MKQSLKILIATGIYPPALGGPALYAFNLKREWEEAGHIVKVKTFDIEHRLPSGVRHFYYFLKILPAVASCDFVYALDTFSVGWPAVCAAKLFRKKIIMRTGGDFLWEGYVERTGDYVLLKDFYNKQASWTPKERRIFRIMKWVLHNVDVLIFSTKWQRDIWMNPYELIDRKTLVIENFYGEKLESRVPQEKNFIGGTRKIKWKNLDMLAQGFSGVDEACLDLANYPHDEYMKKISECYAVVLASLGDISPNMILEAIRHNKPFIMTQENGIMDRVGDIAITVDPQNPRDIREKVLWLCNKENYDVQVEKMKKFTFTHTWKDIADKVIDLYKKL